MWKLLLDPTYKPLCCSERVILQRRCCRDPASFEHNFVFIKLFLGLVMNSTTCSTTLNQISFFILLRNIWLNRGELVVEMHISQC